MTTASSSAFLLANINLAPVQQQSESPGSWFREDENSRSHKSPLNSSAYVWCFCNGAVTETLKATAPYPNFFKKVSISFCATFRSQRSHLNEKALSETEQMMPNLFDTAKSPVVLNLHHEIEHLDAMTGLEKEGT